MLIAQRANVQCCRTRPEYPDWEARDDMASHGNTRVPSPHRFSMQDDFIVSFLDHTAPML